MKYSTRILILVSGVLSGCVSLAPQYIQPAAPIPAEYKRQEPPIDLCSEVPSKALREIEIKKGILSTPAPRSLAKSCTDAADFGGTSTCRVNVWWNASPPKTDSFEQPRAGCVGEQQAAAGKPVQRTSVWELVPDEQIRKLVNLASVNNRNLQVAALNITRAHAQYGVQNSALLPTFVATGGANASRTAADFVLPGQSDINRQYSVGIGLTAYEIDFFGRLKSLKNQALEQFLATEEAARTVEISLFSDIAQVWFNWRADRATLALSRAILDSQQQTLSLMLEQFQRGRVSAWEIKQQEIIVANARGDINRLFGQDAKNRNALTLLVGTELPAELEPQVPAVDWGFDQATGGRSFDITQDDNNFGFSYLPQLAEGLPSDLLLRRPDIRQSEHALKAANANIGAARAAFYPSVSLTASSGSSSTELSGLFDSGTNTWTFMPQINLPIFTGGANKANLTIAKTTRDIALANYEQTIQTAFKEVSDALVDRATIAVQLEVQRALLVASGEALNLTLARYQYGIDDWLDVLNAERTYANARLGYIRVATDQLNNGVILYKVLGGEWRNS